MTEERNDDSSVLGSRVASGLFLLGLSRGSAYLPPAACILILYALAFLWASNAHAAKTCEFVHVKTSGQTLNPTGAQACATWQASNGGTCTYAEGWALGATHICNTKYQQAMAGITGTFVSKNATSWGGNCSTTGSTGKCWLDITVTSVTPASGCRVTGGQVECPGVCAYNSSLLADDPFCMADTCESEYTATPTAVFQTSESNTNPGFCKPGDFQEGTATDVCVEAAELGPGSYCTATVTTNVKLTSLLPVKTVTTQEISYSSSSRVCENPSPPVAMSIDPVTCEEPPPTCAEDQILQDGECVTYLPPINTYTPPTFEGTPTTTTSTTTTTTTTNPDGSVTTVSVTQSQTEKGECPPGEKCDADYVGPDLDDDVKTFSESLDAFYSSVAGASLVTAFDGISNAVPESSSCPTWTVNFNLAGESFSYLLDGHCQAIEDNEGLIRSVMAVCWALLAVFILLSA